MAYAAPRRSAVVVEAFPMAAGANWLVLDERTNHLVLPALELLETALDAYHGIVTHDRHLLDAVALDGTIELPLL